MRESLSIQEILHLLSKEFPLGNMDKLDETTQLLLTTRPSSKLAAATIRKSNAKSKRQRSAKLK